MPEQASYAGVVDGQLVRLPGGQDASREQHVLHATLRAFVLHPSFPCLGAKAALHGDEYRIGAYGDLGKLTPVEALARDLRAFVAEQCGMRSGFSTFAAGFRAVARSDERTFETLLWETLQRLHALDRENAWDAAASSDPQDASFSFSLAGRAFFVVGMHPGSSRLARRFPTPLLLFNAKFQFDALRRDGRFERMQRKIRERDVRLQGSLNPNLAAFGEDSEARQYSGRAVEAEWRCPFRPRSR
ncbi:MAG: YqcI/YcgG family protein [Candidatus Eremiobacteraeota bacterium]|nr:YqcI/YcgG family protein [Candidatus Eremiobacteraeota bacterium]